MLLLLIRRRRPSAGELSALDLVSDLTLCESISDPLHPQSLFETLVVHAYASRWK